jgi:hypothetical protein
MPFSKPATSLIRQRYSCRDYRINSISPDTARDLTDFINTIPAGPFSASNRFQLVTSTSEDTDALKGLGTYGTIKNPPGYIIGVTRAKDNKLEDFGYQMEVIVLKAAGLGLMTCWLGGFFTRSGFAKKIAAGKGEIIPAVCSIGEPIQPFTAIQIEARRSRLNWDALFFEKEFGNPLSFENAGAYSLPLEMLRLAPSAQNKQPWRVIRQDDKWHFYLQRSRGYREMLLTPLTGIVDLQRLDMGIAMAHFELAAKEAGLSGSWLVSDPDLKKPDNLTEYSVSWIASNINN